MLHTNFELIMARHINSFFLKEAEGKKPQHAFLLYASYSLPINLLLNRQKLVAKSFFMFF